MTKVSTPEEYERRIRSVFGLESDGDTGWKYEDIAEARLTLKDMRFKQKSLRMTKKEVNQDIKTIRAYYRDKSANAGAGTDFLGIFTGKQRARSLRANDRRRIAAKRDETLFPYNNLKSIIDGIILDIDRGKLEVEKYIVEQG